MSFVLTESIGFVKQDGESPEDHEIRLCKHKNSDANNVDAWYISTREHMWDDSPGSAIPKPEDMQSIVIDLRNVPEKTVSVIACFYRPAGTSHASKLSFSGDVLTHHEYVLGYLSNADFQSERRMVMVRDLRKIRPPPRSLPTIVPNFILSLPASQITPSSTDESPRSELSMKRLFSIITMYLGRFVNPEQYDTTSGSMRDEWWGEDSITPREDTLAQMAMVSMFAMHSVRAPQWDSMARAGYLNMYQYHCRKYPDFLPKIRVKFPRYSDCKTDQQFLERVMEDYDAFVNIVKQKHKIAFESMAPKTAPAFVSLSFHVFWDKLDDKLSADLHKMMTIKNQL